MEENYDQCSQGIEEEQHTLLSYKVKELSQKSTKFSLSLKASSMLNKYTLKDSILEKSQTSSTSKDRNINTSSPTKPKNGLSQFCKRSSTPIRGNLVSQLHNKLKNNKQRYSNTASLKKSKDSPSEKKSVSFKFVKSQRAGGRLATVFQPQIYFKNEVNGEGTLFFQNGGRMESYFCEGIPLGKSKIRYSNGALYQGDVYEYKSHGLGKLRLPEGQVFIGEFCDGQPHGEGIQYDGNGNIVRQGEWKRGKYFR